MRHAFISPQLATLVNSPPTGAGWGHELKFDGYRMLCWRDGTSVEIVSRNGHDWSQRFPSLAKAVLSLKIKSGLIDGEAVVLDKKGVSSFALMQDAMARKNDLAVVYYAFDLLQLDGDDLRKLPLIERKERLRKIIPAKSFKVQYSDHLVGDGAKMLKHACALGLEGIVSKQLNAPYRSERSADWLKTKCLLRQEFVVVGYSERTNAPNDFGSLLLGAYEKNKLVYTGSVGTGWNERVRASIYSKLAKLEAKKPAVDLPMGVSAAGVHWVKPKLVAEVSFSNWTNDGVLRHPSFQGLREDKSAAEVVVERPASIPGLKGGGDWKRARRR